MGGLGLGVEYPTFPNQVLDLEVVLWRPLVLRTFTNAKPGNLRQGNSVTRRRGMMCVPSCHS